MLERAAPWRSIDAWAGIAHEGRSGNLEGAAGVALRALPHVDMATIILGRGDQAAFADRVAQRWGFPPPAEGRTRFGAAGGLVGTSPGQWLAIAARDGTLDGLADALSGTATIAAQGDGRALVEIEGPQARRMLAKVLSIDFDPAVFAPGSAATTAMAHLSVQLWWQDGSTALTLCAARTVAASVWRLLVASAAEYGATVE